VPPPTASSVPVQRFVLKVDHATEGMILEAAESPVAPASREERVQGSPPRSPIAISDSVLGMCTFSPPVPPHPRMPDRFFLTAALQLLSQKDERETEVADIIPALHVLLAGECCTVCSRCCARLRAALCRRVARASPSRVSGCHRAVD
jgi:hypothetical protein